MRKAYRAWRRAVSRALVWMKYYSVAVMLLMLALAFFQVVRRYVFNSPWVFSDEVVLLLLAWFSYPALVFNIWTDDHFNISSVYDKFPKTLKKVCDVARHLLIGVFCGYLGYFGWKLTGQYWPKAMPASGWSQGLKFLPVLAGGALSCLFCLSNLIGVFISDPDENTAEESVEKEGKAC